MRLLSRTNAKIISGPESQRLQRGAVSSDGETTGHGGCHRPIVSAEPREFFCRPLEFSGSGEEISLLTFVSKNVRARGTPVASGIKMKREKVLVLRQLFLVTVQTALTLEINSFVLITLLFY